MLVPSTCTKLNDMALNRVTTPFPLGDGTVCNKYGTLRKGMHAGLPEIGRAHV